MRAQPAATGSLPTTAETSAGRAALVATVNGAIALAGAARVAIFLHLEEGLRLVARRGFGTEAARALGETLARQECRFALDTGAALWGAGMPEPLAQWCATHNESDILAVLLPKVGVLVLGFRPPARVTAARVAAAEHLAALAALAIHGARRVPATVEDRAEPVSPPPPAPEADQHLAFIQALTDALMATVAASDDRSAAAAAADTICRSMPGIDLVNVWLADEEAGVLRRLVSRGDPAAIVTDELPLAETVGAAHALRDGRVRVWTGDLATWPERLRAYAAESGLATVAHVPMHSGGRVIGVLTLGSRVARTYSDAEEAFLATLAGQLGGQLDAAHGLQRAEAEQRRLLSLIETLPQGLLILDADGRVREANATARELLGGLGGIADGGTWEQLLSRLSVRDAQGRPLSATEWPIARALRGETVRGDEISIFREGGGEVPLLVSGGPVRDREGVVTGAVCAFQDITHLKELDRLKDEFINTVSHELRTPTTTIRGGALTLLRRGDRLDEATRRELLQDIADEAERLHHLLEDVLSLSRSRAGMQLTPEPLRLHRVVAKVRQEMGGRLARCTLVIDLPPRLPLVEADPLLLEQVLRNLLENAVQYSPRGGSIEVSAASLGKEVRVTVADRGDGIPAADRDRVFEPFYRTPAAVAAGTQGAGLGLAVCRRLVELSGGRIWAEARRGGGTAFHFTLPVVGDTADA